MKEAPDWHTYWQYPGDAGFPTKIEWTLPPGFKAGPIQWPLPVKQIDDGDLQSYVYKDEVMLMVEITPPQMWTRKTSRSPPGQAGSSANKSASPAMRNSRSRSRSYRKPPGRSPRMATSLQNTAHSCRSQVCKDRI